jgi:hypothetical protein
MQMEATIPKTKAPTERRRWAAWAYGLGAAGYALLFAIILLIAGGLLLINLLFPGPSAAALVFLPLLGVGGPLVLLLLMGSLLVAGVALVQRWNGWLALYMVLTGLLLLTPLSYFLPNSWTGGRNAAQILGAWWWPLIATLVLPSALIAARGFWMEHRARRGEQRFVQASVTNTKRLV